MRTVPFRSILEWLARRMLGSEANLTPDFAGPYVDMINSAVRDGWEREFWPEWTLIEERFYRAAWTAGTYAAGVELYHTGTYWRALSSTAAEPATGVGSWEECGVGTAARLEPYITLAQSGQQPIGTPRGLTLHDPRQYPGSFRIPFGLTAQGVEVRASARNFPSVWLEYRLPPPVFTGRLWNATDFMRVGTRVYHPTTSNGGRDPEGECWLALADNVNQAPGSTDYWRQIDFPYVLAEFVKKAAYAEALGDDGQHDKMSVQHDFAEDELATEWTKAESQTGALRTFNVLTREVRTGHFRPAHRCP